MNDEFIVNNNLLLTFFIENAQNALPKYLTLLCLNVIIILKNNSKIHIMEDKSEGKT